MQEAVAILEQIMRVFHHEMEELPMSWVDADMEIGILHIESHESSPRGEGWENERGMIICNWNLHMNFFSDWRSRIGHQPPPFF